MSARIEVMPAALADQIAAGEVVERPASIVKELVENAVDAGARRVEVELAKGGAERIVVLDDGAGMHPEDLPLSITRHATSKVRQASDLVEIGTLGFRGEALASIAAVADVTMESRRADDTAGTRMRSRPGLPPELSPIGRGVGTRVEVTALFVNVPARRKFLRSEATEVGHCTDTMVRLAISHPHVHLRLKHGPRTLLDLPSAALPERIAAVLARRVRAPITRVQGVHEGVDVEAFLAPPSAAVKGRGQSFVVVRRRVVRERALTSAITAAYGDLLPSGHGPVACVRVDPPAGEVDVNVHPQKAEVRFSDPQAVYAAARHVLALAAAQWDAAPAPATGSRFSVGAREALDRSMQAERPHPEHRERGAARFSAGAARGSTYRLRTAAARDDYDAHRAESRAAAGRLRDRLSQAQPREPAPRQETIQVPDPEPVAQGGPALALLTCLPGPVALLRLDDAVVSVDLKRLRSHLVYERLVAELGGGSVGAQGLLAPVVVRRDKRDVELCLAREDALRELGVVVEAFGDDALLVRAVPAQLRDCVDEPDIDDLVDKVVAWLRVESPASESAQTGTHAMAAVLAGARGADPAPRLARRWVRELLEQERDLAKVPGIRVFTAEDLT
ncbi:MAG: DNA mismatch repair endonuclease MutL [Nannocystaceae bacterium]|nr:DNA mismatch repair endonuclease MutL [bacterium]